MLSDQEIRSLRSSASKAELTERADVIRLSITRTFPEKSENRGLLLRALDEKVDEISPSLPDISPRTLAQIEAEIARAMTVADLAEKLRQYEAMAARYGDVRLALERGKEQWEEQQALARRQEQERVEAIRRAQLEDAEFEALVDEVSAKGFTESREVSNYIMANKLGRKYRHISASWSSRGMGRLGDITVVFPLIFMRDCAKLWDLVRSHQMRELRASNRSVI